MVETLQRNPDVWLVHYNTERPHRGYRNLDRCPIEATEPAWKVFAKKPGSTRGGAMGKRQRMDMSKGASFIHNPASGVKSCQQTQRNIRQIILYTDEGG